MQRIRKYHVYILTNKHNTVLYTGVTNNLHHRINQHKKKEVKGFTSKYNVDRLVYIESYKDIDRAIAREKQIKNGSRQKKEDLINTSNPDWRDLSDEIWDL
jgi:putative endonuclease